MIIRINEKDYDCNIYAITPIRYRAFFGTSFIEEFMNIENDHTELLIKLLYISIWDFKKPYSDFASDCKNDKSFLYKAFWIRDEMFAYKKSYVRDGDIDEVEEFDEFMILAQMAVCGLPDRLLDELKLMQICEVVRQYSAIKNPSENTKILKGKALKKELGITEDIEKQIIQALKGECE